MSSIKDIGSIGMIAKVTFSVTIHNYDIIFSFFLYSWFSDTEFKFIS